MKKGSKTLYQILPHILISGILLCIPFNFGHTDFSSISQILLRILGPLVALLVFYFNYLYLVERFLFSKKLLKYISINALLITLFVLIGNSSYYQRAKLDYYKYEKEVLLKEFQMNYGDSIVPENLDKDFHTFFHNKKNNKYKTNRKGKREFAHALERNHGRFYSRKVSIAYIVFQFLAMFAAIGIKYGKKAIQEESKRKDIEAEYLKSKNELLKYQIQPHFFFNTLNSIHYLIDISTEQAKNTVLDLSKLMRYVLNVSEKEDVLLDKEIEFIQHYCDLMILRTPDNLEFKLQLNNNNPKRTIAPLLLVVLIENAFKHGIGGRDTDFISINLSTSKSMLHFSVVNSKYKETVEKHDNVSIGLENLKSRLNLLYNNKYTLDVIENDHEYQTNLTITL
ncbi:MAG: sensor histidine kinase [Flavobacteriales bacterium]